MKRVYLVRHGDVTQKGIPRYFGISDVELNEDGRRQLNGLFDFMNDKKFRCVYSSNLIRTKHMAHHISSNHNIEHKIFSEFNEINFGKWEGLSFDEIKKLYPEDFSLWINKNLSFTFPGGESLIQVRERVLPKYKQIISEYQDNMDILMILHRSVIKIILCDALNSPDSFWFINQDYCALNIIDYFPDNHHIISLVNDTNYLISGKNYA